MAGNEVAVVEYLFDRLNQIDLKHIGKLNKIGNPSKSGKIKNLNSYQELKSVKTEASLKKADIYLNEVGVSIKQEGGNFLYNRLQREGIKPVLEKLNINNKDEILNKLDEEVLKYHQGERDDRNIKWNDIFKRRDFYDILKYLMMTGYPKKESEYKAKFILEAPKNIKDDKNIKLYIFDEYFNEFQDKIVLSIRRQWVGQKSNSEHKRALGLSKKKDNEPWVFKSIVGQPSGWRDDFLEDERKTVYFLMIEKLA